MDIAIMISKNNKTSDSHRLNSSDKIAISLVIKLLIQLQKYQKVYRTIIQKQIKVKQKIQNLLEKYQMKDMYFQSKVSKLSMV